MPAVPTTAVAAAAVAMGFCFAMDTAFVTMDVLRPIDSDVEDDALLLVCWCADTALLLFIIGVLILTCRGVVKADAVEASRMLLIAVEEITFMLVYC